MRRSTLNPTQHDPPSSTRFLVNGHCCCRRGPAAASSAPAAPGSGPLPGQPIRGLPARPAAGPRGSGGRAQRGQHPGTAGRHLQPRQQAAQTRAHTDAQARVIRVTTRDVSNHAVSGHFPSQRHAPSVIIDTGGRGDPRPSSELPLPITPLQHLSPRPLLSLSPSPLPLLPLPPSPSGVRA